MPPYPHRASVGRMARVVSWFSCGAASAVATKLALTSNALPFDATEVVIANCQIVEEHPDNERFLRDCENWFGVPVTILGNKKYGCSAHSVFRKTRFLVGPSGARCTGELKRQVRHNFQRPDDVILMGFTAEEKHRQVRFSKAEWPMRTWPILIEQGLTKADCVGMLHRAGIDIPAMYLLGYKNNNCIGCVKGQAGYWNKIRIDFPEVFAEMAIIEREIGIAICKIEWVEGGKRKLRRVFLDELSPDAGRYDAEPDISCGIQCEISYQDTLAAANSTCLAGEGE